MTIRITRTRLIIAAALAVAAAAWFLADWLIVTDAKRVGRTLDALAHAVEQNDADAVAPLLDPSFRMGGMTAEEFVPWYARTLERVRVTRVSQYDRKITIDPRDRDLAVAEVLAIVVLERPEGESRINWRLEFRRRGKDEWKLASVRAWWPLNNVEIPLGAVNEWLR